MTLRRRLLAFTVLASLLAFGAAIPAAYADTPVPDNGQGDEHHKFPMTAAEFRGHVAEHVEQRRQHMESRIADKQLPKDKADERRAHFTAAVATLNAKVDEVCKDGTVTGPEALQVRELFVSLFHHHSGGQGDNK